MAERGFALSVSVEALREVWARSIRENDAALLAERATMLNRYLERDSPIAFVAAALLTTIGTTAPELRAGNEKFRAQVTNGWRALAERGLGESEWRAIGKALDDELADEERFWLSLVEQAENYGRTVRHFNAENPTATYPRERAVAVMRRGLADGLPARTEPPMSERFDGLFRYLPHKLANAVESRPARNDYNDARYLYHLGWPAFVMTADFRLVEAVDRSGTFQRAWVRTPVELAEDRLARSVPWGKPAREICDAMAPRSRRMLSERLELWRSRLRT